jgi:ABC-type multidrug transport system ATPase subunit
MGDPMMEHFTLMSPHANILPGSSYIRQVAIMLKISFIRKFRAPTVWLEIALPGMFFVFVCLFSARFSLWSDPLPHPGLDAYMPFSAVPGPSPQYAIIPDNNQTHLFADSFQASAIVGSGADPESIRRSMIFFDTFDSFLDWMQQNRETKDVFYAVELRNDNLTHADVRISSNGMTQFELHGNDIQTVPDFVRTTTSALLSLSKGTRPQIFLEWSKLPTGSIFQTDEKEDIEMVIFCTVLFIPAILTAATNYGTEAESGLRDLFVFFGLSMSANRLRWYIDCFAVSFVLSILFAVAIWAWVGIDFWLLVLTFFLGAGSIVSLTYALIAIWPTQAMGRVVGLGILMSFFVVFFWALFSWLYTDDGYYEKRILSLLPAAAIPYTLGQIISGHCTGFSKLHFPEHYPVRMGLTYMAAEMVLYYVAFIIIDCLNATKWYRAPWKWGRAKASEEVTAVQVDWLHKYYGETLVLSNLCFQVETGETLAIIGPNGAGKSTLLSILASALPATSGEVTFRGLDVTRDLRAMHSMVGFCPQQNLFMNELNAPEWFGALCVLRGVPDFDYSELVAALGLEHQLESRIGDMSGGNKRKICLASALLGNPAIVILDEATSGVDFTSRTRIWSLIAGLKQTTVIMATHTLEECEKIADRIMVLAGGEITVLKTPTELRQEFKCGYLLETDEANVPELTRIMVTYGIERPEIEVVDEQAKVVIPAEESHALMGILKDINFHYLMSIQSLEEKIFAHVQEHEMAYLLNKDHDMNDQDEDLHPRV